MRVLKYDVMVNYVKGFDVLIVDVFLRVSFQFIFSSS